MCQFRVCGEECSDRRRRLIVVRVEIERLEPGVLSDEIRRIIGQPRGEIDESLAISGRFQILDDVELDTGGFEKTPNLACGASAAVEIQGDHAVRLQAGVSFHTATSR